MSGNLGELSPSNNVHARVAYIYIYETRLRLVHVQVLRQRLRNAVVLWIMNVLVIAHGKRATNYR